MGMQSPSAGSAAAKPASKETVSSVEGVLNLAIGPVPYHRLKQLIDLVGSTALVVVVAPLFLLVGLLIAADVGLPLVFWQQRPGLHRRPFKLYKFPHYGSSLWC
jgi:lipopolysaccharide/colanic/teichoic acid biosynthesis glycosyltransferase